MFLRRVRQSTAQVPKCYHQQRGWGVCSHCFPPGFSLQSSLASACLAARALRPSRGRALGGHEPGAEDLPRTPRGTRPVCPPRGCPGPGPELGPLPEAGGMDNEGEAATAREGWFSWIRSSAATGKHGLDKPYPD